MFLKFRTKPDVNGNFKFLNIDTVNARYTTKYSLFSNDLTESITVSTKDIKRMHENIKECGFTEENTCF